MSEGYPADYGYEDDYAYEDEVSAEDLRDQAQQLQEMGQTLAHYQQQQQAERQLAIEQQELANEAGWQKLQSEYSVLDAETPEAAAVQEQLVGRVEQLAHEAHQRGEVAHPDVLLEDPSFVRQVWESREFDGVRGYRELEGGEVFIEMHREQNRPDSIRGFHNRLNDGWK
jgi:hypothetical protein